MLSSVTCVQATTSFIEQHPELFQFSTREASIAAKLLSYLAELVRMMPGAYAVQTNRIEFEPDKHAHIYMHRCLSTTELLHPERSLCDGFVLGLGNPDASFTC